MTSLQPPDGRTPAALVLADGSVFEGEHIGAESAGGVASGEVVFNTALSGYQEVITDPSYAGQIITFTYPHIGNYGAVDLDNESRSAFARGIIVRDLTRRPSSWRAEGDLESLLVKLGLVGIAGVDTRRLTRLLRDTGAMPGALGPLGVDGSGLERLIEAAKAEPGTDGVDLVEQVTTPSAYTVAGHGSGMKRIVAYDFGVKTSIVDRLAGLGTVEVVPASTPAAAVLDMQADGVFLSNGPGDPAEVSYAVDAVGALVGQVPVFGICLGHQILSLALGGDITKLPFGHHGANHPVRNEVTGEVEITSQNHNFAVDGASLADVAEITHVNLNDGICEGIRAKGAPAFSVQHHPEASPGPHDSAYLFDRFDELMDKGV